MDMVAEKLLEGFLEDVGGSVCPCNGGPSICIVNGTDLVADFYKNN